MGSRSPVRVVAFARDYDTCNHIRIRIVAKQMKKDELCTIDIVDADTNMQDINLIMEKGLADCDVVWFGRASSVSMIKTILELQRLGKKCVLDLDDDIFKVSPYSNHYMEWGVDEVVLEDGTKLWTDGIDGFRIADNKDRIEMFKELIRIVDCLTVTTRRLAEVYLPLQKNVAVVPNSVDLTKWIGSGTTKVVKTDPEETRIVWMGGSSHYEDMWEIAEVIPAIVKQYPKAKWVVVGQYFDFFFKDLPPQNVERVPWSHIEAYPFAARHLGADIGVCPLRTTDFNTGKSSIKFYEYSALGIPTVASAIPPYSDDIKHDHSGLLAHDTNSWLKRLSYLIENPLERARLAGNALRYVEKHHALSEVAKIQTNVFASLAGKELVS